MDYTIEPSNVPLLSMEQKQNPVLRIEASITSHQNSDFVITQAVYGTASREDTQGSRDRPLLAQSDRYRLDNRLVKNNSFDAIESSGSGPLGRDQAGSQPEAEIVFRQAEFDSLQA
mmetsp:Transcript_28522/g.35245  ORF Transcript_28522/g.35245 Transcript_28522/m.35245 type:complete len:116 (+) Transcript_28522:2115-2462(+)